jgi:tetratricopeptide (TPR) repeat protein
MRRRSISKRGIRVLCAAALAAFVAFAALAAGPVAAQTNEREAAPQPTPEELERALKKRLANNSKDYEAAYDLGKHHYAQGRRDQAEQAFRRVLEIKPEYVPALVELGLVLNESGKSEEALGQFDRALAVNPTDTGILCHKGQALYALQRREEAVRHYLQAIRLDPRGQIAHYWLGIAFADAGIYREAILEWQRVVEVDDGSELGRAAAEGIEVLKPMVGP